MVQANKQQNHVRHQVGLTVALIILISAATLATGPIRPASAQADARSWSYTGSLNTPRSGYTATLLPSGKVLVTGGYNYADGALASAELYDPSTGTWSYTASLNTSRSGHSATLLQNGKVLVLGGGNNSGELYDPATGAWSHTGGINIPPATATLLKNGKVLILGGTDYFANVAELYDPATGTSSVTGRLNTWRGGYTATLLQNGKVLVAGGINGADFSEFSTELYDPTTGTWSVTGTLNAARGWHTATLLPNGNVLVAGACNDGISCGSRNSSAELYNPATGTWSITGELNTPRFFHAATLLPDGQVLIVGGKHFDFFSGTSVLLNSAEIYNPATGHWKNAGELNAPRAYHTATLLSDGKVLVVGGYEFRGEYLRSAELYDPEILDPAPKIISASVSGKKLFIAGENFHDGAVILLNGEEQKTKQPAANPQTTLIGKKAGKKINAGDHIQVRNPDGTLSAEFIFTGSQDMSN